MSTFIVLLRGINVGGNNVLPMAELVELLISIGCENVRTYIQSGNVVLDCHLEKAQLSQKIEVVILKAKGFQVSILVLTLKELQCAVKENPYRTDVGKFLHLYFPAKAQTNPDFSLLEESKCSSEQFDLKGRVLYLYTPDGIGRSKLATKIEKAMGVPTTARNWNTVQKLLDMATN